jgi:hypothetical protein
LLPIGTLHFLEDVEMKEKNSGEKNNFEKHFAQFGRQTLEL